MYKPKTASKLMIFAASMGLEETKKLLRSYVEAGEPDDFMPMYSSRAMCRIASLGLERIPESIPTVSYLDTRYGAELYGYMWSGDAAKNIIDMDFSEAESRVMDYLFAPFLGPVDIDIIRGGKTLPRVKPFSFDDFVKKMEKNIADSFEIPVELLDVPWIPGFPSIGVSGIMHQSLGRGLRKKPAKAFADAKKGDKVYDVRHGWGEIVHPRLPAPFTRSGAFHVEVSFPEDPRRHFYRPDGRIKHTDTSPSLYWDEVKIDAPTRPAETVTKYKVRYLRKGRTDCSVSQDHYTSAEDFKKVAPLTASKSRCFCLDLSTAEDFPA